MITRPQLTTLFFDLDETLYPASTGLWQVIRAKMEEYMHERMGIPMEEIPALRLRFYSQYGTTLRGLQATRHVDTSEYLAFVHDVPLAEHLTPDPAVRAMLLSLPQRKLIFTNADMAHAKRVLAALQLEDCFEQIIDVVAIAPHCKPEEESFQIALKLAGNPDPRECLLIDDAAHNLIAARRLGFYTVLYGQEEPCPDIDTCLSRLVDFPSILPNSLAS